MKKSMLTLVIAALFMVNYAVGQTFEKGNSALNLGVGIGGVGLTGLGFSATFEIGLFPVGDDFGVIGIGALVGYNSEKILGTSFNDLGFAPRGTFHFSVIPVEKLDVYAAVEPFTVVIHSNDISGSSNNTSVDVFSVSAGARYFFSENMAVFAETGYGFNYLTGGISFKF